MSEEIATHIVPLFAPVIDGVGDYALNLARQFRDRFGLSNRIIVCDPVWRGPAEVDGFAVAGPSGFDGARFTSLLGGARNLVLHYVGYGFHPRGIPTWLVEALEKWSRQTPGSHLVTVFHEIWSSGPPWRSVFYLAPIQRRLVGRILKLSKCSFISTRWAERELRAIKPEGVIWLPVSSNVRPASSSSRRSRRNPPWRPLFFGQTWTRKPAVERHARLLRALHEGGLLDKVLVMGKEARTTSPESDDVALLKTLVPSSRIEALGEKTADNAAASFHEADFNLSLHPARDACKSGAIMGAFACECPVALTNGAESAPLVEDEHFLVCDGSKPGIERFLSRLSNGALPAISAQAKRWYQSEASWEKVAGEIGRSLGLSRISIPNVVGA